MTLAPPSRLDYIRATFQPFSRAVIGGLGIVLPPLLTLVILLWAWNTVHYYVLDPVTYAARNVLVRALREVRTELPGAQSTADDPTVYVTPDGASFKQLERGEFIPLHVYNAVVRHDGAAAMSSMADSIYHRYIELKYLRPIIIIPVFFVVFIVLMYLLGSLFAAGVGQALWTLFEQGVGRLPFIRGVYGSVKQVTDFMLTETELEFTRVVAVEYPTKGIWSLAFVTGDGMRDVRIAAGEPVLAILVPTSPMPVTGTTMMVRKSEVVDLDLTVDQAIQFIVSCGVVAPPETAKRVADRLPQLNPPTNN